MASASGNSDHQARRLYELETTIAQLRESNTQLQKTGSRLERERQRAEEELETLNKAHSRLEAQLFEAESQLGAASSKLDRTQRTNTTMQTTLEARVASLEREREGLKKKESELAADLAAAKRRATIQRRQTVSATSGHSRSGSTAGTTSFGRMSMFAHDMPPPPPPPFSSRHTDSLVDVSAAAADDDKQQIRHLQTQIKQLSRKLRESEEIAQQANDQTAHMHAEAEQAHRRQISDLETAIKQLTELNESLREDNESYQMLLQMSTMKGGLSFGNSSARRSLDSRSSSGKWAASPGAPDGGDSPDGGSAFDGAASPDIGLDLASELGQALSLDEGPSMASDLVPVTRSRMADLEEKVIQLKEDLRKTKYERRHLSDENKAMSLYINKILARIMASPNGLEAILSNDYEKKPGAATKPKQSPTPSSASSFSAPATKLVRREVARAPSASASNASPPPPQQQQKLKPSLPVAVQGSGDGVTSVFVPPTSPTMPHANAPLLPVKENKKSMENKAEHVPPPYTRRVRSATVAVDMVPDIKLVNRSAGAATISNGSSGTWWRRMSVLRMGGAW
ncbi:hypothetical protein EV175_003427, partial [Coemansia sp. RSA 1933]